MSIRERLSDWRWRRFGQTKRELADECDDLLSMFDRLRQENNELRRRLNVVWYAAHPEYRVRADIARHDSEVAS